MKRILSISILLALSLMTFAQEITVRFTGQLNGTAYQQLDSVVVTNTTRGWTETVVCPDTLIVLGSTVNISENEALVAGLGQNVPNPFDCQTRVQLTVSQLENVHMQLLDANGKLYADYNGAMDAGTHEFGISAANTQTFILNAFVGERQYSIKMVNVGKGSTNSIRYVGKKNCVSPKLISANEFQRGDNMVYVGYVTIDGEVIASDEISQPQYEDQTVMLNFVCYFLPEVETFDITDIGENVAVCGGVVHSDGGAEVIARGVCWSTSSNPTIADSHTADGVGLGNFASNVTGLAPNTTYYICAYATNSKGTGYGKIKSFTTHMCACGEGLTITDYDGNVYGTVLIGQQCWMASNMRTTHFADGISLVHSSTDSSSNIAYYYYPGNSVSNVAGYGLLYNWPAAMHNASSSYTNPSQVQGICPNGWHLPSDAEWTQLTDYVSSQSQYQCGSTTTDIAKALASATGWNSSINPCAPGNTPSTNNSTGFGAKPSGYYNPYTYIEALHDYCFFWSSTETPEHWVYHRHSFYCNSFIHRAFDQKSQGFSVRCVRD